VDAFVVVVAELEVEELPGWGGVPEFASVVGVVGSGFDEAGDGGAGGTEFAPGGCGAIARHGHNLLQGNFDGGAEVECPEAFLPVEVEFEMGGGEGEVHFGFWMGDGGWGKIDHQGTKTQRQELSFIGVLCFVRCLDHGAFGFGDEVLGAFGVAESGGVEGDAGDGAALEVVFVGFVVVVEQVVKGGVELVRLEEGDRLLGALPTEAFTDAFGGSDEVVEGSLGVKLDQQIQPFGFGAHDFEDGGFVHLLKQGIGDAALPDAFAFGFNPHPLLWIELGEFQCQLILELFVCRLGGQHQAAKAAAPVVRHAFQVEDLFTLGGEGIEDVGFSRASHAAEDGDRPLLLKGFQHPAAKGFVASCQRCNLEACHFQHPGDGSTAHSATPAVDAHLSVGGDRLGFLDKVGKFGSGDRKAQFYRRIPPLLLVAGSHFRPLVVGE